MDNNNTDLSKNNYIGKVIFNNDPDYSGRCRIRVYGLMDDLDDSLLPWFSPQTMTTFSSDTGAGSLSVPKVGAYVRVRFANNDIYSGEYTSIQNVDPYMIEEIKDDYEGTHVICYDADQELMVAFQVNSGITISYRDAIINISPSNVISAATPNNNAIVELDNDTVRIVSKGNINVTAPSVDVNSNVARISSNSVNIGNGHLTPAVKGEALVNVLNLIVKELNAKNPMGWLEVPTEDILSNSVKISQ